MDDLQEFNAEQYVYGLFADVVEKEAEEEEE
jgi:fused signal recognition particle receptor